MTDRVETFFVGGEYVTTARGSQMAGHAYVEHRSQGSGARELPIVMIHGGGQTSVNFETTPDGRRGWADFFIESGFDVYLVDQVGRGRSGYAPDAYGPVRPANTALMVEQRWTAIAAHGLWPQAHLHTQWPGSGRRGDPVFDQFMCSQVPGVLDFALQEQLMRSAGAALLDRIGPAILLTHSQSGPVGWHIADARPDLVRGIVAVEPNGPPFVDAQVMMDIGHVSTTGSIVRPYGLTITPLEYFPAVDDPAQDLPLVRESRDGDLEWRCIQRSPARQLLNLSGLNVLVVTGQASHHELYDHCTVEYLRQVGVAAEHLRLVERGITGNGHMMMVEQNNLLIAAVIVEWLDALLSTSTC